MKFIKLVYFISMLFIISSCDRTRDEIKNTALGFDSLQNARWNKVAALYKANPKFFDTSSLFKNVTDGVNFSNTQSIAEIFARAYIGEYKNRNPAQTVIFNGQTVNFATTQSVWLDKKVIYTFMNSFLKSDSIDGIRVYFSQYFPDASKLDPSISEESNGMKNVIFVATKIDKMGHRDYWEKESPTSVSGLYIYDYNSLCPKQCTEATLGGY